MNETTSIFKQMDNIILYLRNTHISDLVDKEIFRNNLDGTSEGVLIYRTGNSNENQRITETTCAVSIYKDKLQDCEQLAEDFYSFFKNFNQTKYNKTELLTFWPLSAPTPAFKEGDKWVSVFDINLKFTGENNEL